MSNLTHKEFFSKEAVQSKFKELLKDKSAAFITNVLQIASNNKLLEKASPISLFNAACTAAILDLPLSLGYSFIVPYKGQAGFQIGFKGLIQLAYRTNQYQKLNVTEIYENQFISWNGLTETLEVDMNKEPMGNIHGYGAYFKLNNGMLKTIYWTDEKVKAHATKYSQTYNKKNKEGQLMFSEWNNPQGYVKMALKTVLKSLLSTWGWLSVDMQRAIHSDQSVIQDVETQKVLYVDNPENKTIAGLTEEQIEAMLQAEEEKILAKNKKIVTPDAEEINFEESDESELDVE